MGTDHFISVHTGIVKLIFLHYSYKIFISLTFKSLNLSVSVVMKMKPRRYSCINVGADVNSKNAKGVTPLIIAAVKGHYSVLRKLANNPNIRLHEQVGQSPYM